MRKSIQIYNLTTGELYPSLTVAGRKLGFLSNLIVPEHLRDGNSAFWRAGYELIVIKS